jgi:hypothetical protein
MRTAAPSAVIGGQAGRATSVVPGTRRVNARGATMSHAESPVPLVVTLTDEEIAEAHRLGDEAFELYRANRRYYNNLGPSYRKRKLGEIAVERWASTLGVEVLSPFRDVSLTSREDLVVGGVRLEVKTWHAPTWAAKGRSVAPGQVPGIREKADAIVWCSVDGGDVTLRGWSTVDDVETAPLAMTGTAQHPATAHQVPIEALRPMGRLVDDAPR